MPITKSSERRIVRRQTFTAAPSRLCGSLTIGTDTSYHNLPGCSTVDGPVLGILQSRPAARDSARHRVDDGPRFESVRAARRARLQRSRPPAPETSTAREWRRRRAAPRSTAPARPAAGRGMNCRDISSIACRSIPLARVGEVADGYGAAARSAPNSAVAGRPGLGSGRARRRARLQRALRADDRRSMARPLVPLPGPGGRVP